MSKVSIVYWTQGGNTQAMAEAIGEGVTAAGGEADVVFVSDANIADLKAEGAFALGCPAMGAEVLEEMEMEPFVQDVERFANGKKIALFGSYGWGDGEWMRLWEKRCDDAGMMFACDYVICNEAPDDEAKEACAKLGAALA